MAARRYHVMKALYFRVELSASPSCLSVTGLVGNDQDRLYSEKNLCSVVW
jgi:hypothetical protein